MYYTNVLDLIGNTPLLGLELNNGSSGANVWAAKLMAEKYGRDKVIATVLPDRAERYFSTALI